jgi:molybdenum ABC transporter molybdate-binding protein
LLVAAASNFSAPMNELVLRFEARTDHKVEVAYGSSGRLFAQISNGAPFQIFFSADQDKPERLLASGLAVPGSRFTYATGALVLWNADDKVAVPDAFGS